MRENENIDRLLDPLSDEDILKLYHGLSEDKQEDIRFFLRKFTQKEQEREAIQKFTRKVLGY